MLDEIHGDRGGEKKNNEINAKRSRVTTFAMNECRRRRTRRALITAMCSNSDRWPYGYTNVFYHSVCVSLTKRVFANVLTSTCGTIPLIGRTRFLLGTENVYGRIPTTAGERLFVMPDLITTGSLITSYHPRCACGRVQYVRLQIAAFN